MTLAGLGWVLMWGLVSFYLLRWMWRTRERPERQTEPAASVPGLLRRTTAPLPHSGSLPRGWTTEDYAADGIRQLQIMLIQHSRRDRRLPDESGQA